MKRQVNIQMITMRLVLAAMLLVVSGGVMRAQGGSTDAAATEMGAELWRAGVVGGFGLIGYTADFIGLPGVPSCCPHYESGSGNNAMFGVSGEIRMAPNLSGGLRVLYARYAGTLTSDEDELVTSGTDTVTAVFRHTIDATQPAIATEAFVTYSILPHFNVTGGARADVMLGGTYHQTEDIVSPSTIRFENDQRQRLVFDGDIPQEKRLHLALQAGLRYDVPINPGRTLMLSPEVQLWQGLGDLVDGITWKMRGIRFGLGLSFLKLDGSREPSPLEPGKTVESQKPAVETKPDQPADDKKPKTDPDPDRKPNTGASTNVDIHTGQP